MGKGFITCDRHTITIQLPGVSSTAAKNLELFGPQVNLLASVAEAYLVVPKNIVATKDISSLANREKSCAAREFMFVTL